MDYNVTIQMSQETINYLRDGKYTLFGFKSLSGNMLNRRDHL
jgi:hypothetical protein